jgi:hypothetical protein
LIAGFAQKCTRLHFPLPFWLVSIFVSELFFAYGAYIRDFFSLKDEGFCLFYMAAAAEPAFNTPFFARLVLVTTKLFAAYSAMNDLLFAEYVQVKFYMP